MSRYTHTGTVGTGPDSLEVYEDLEAIQAEVVCRVIEVVADSGMAAVLNVLAEHAELEADGWKDDGVPAAARLRLAEMIAAAAKYAKEIEGR